MSVSTVCSVFRVKGHPVVLLTLLWFVQFSIITVISFFPHDIYEPIYRKE